MEQKKQMDRRVVTILLIVFVQMMGAAMILPILPLWAQNEFDMSPTVITLLVSSFFAAQFVAGPYLGRLSDKYGRIPVLIVSQIGTVISFLALGLAPSAWVLFVARIVDGITGGNIIVAQAYLTDITPAEKRTEALGYIMAMFGLGFVLGPAVGGILTYFVGARVSYFVAAGAAAFVVFLTWSTLEETVTDEKRANDRQKPRIRYSQLLTNGLLVTLFVIAFVGQFGLGMLQSTFALYTEAVTFAGMNLSDGAVALGVGLLLGSFGLSLAITQAFLLKPMLARFRETTLVIIGCLCRMAGMFIFALAPPVWVIAASCVLFALGSGLMMPPLQSLSTTLAPDEMRGGILGIYNSVINLATIISTAIAGTIFAFSPTMPYWVGGVLLIVALLPAILLFLRYQPAVQTIKLS